MSVTGIRKRDERIKMRWWMVGVALTTVLLLTLTEAGNTLYAETKIGEDLPSELLDPDQALKEEAEYKEDLPASAPIHSAEEKQILLEMRKKLENRELQLAKREKDLKILKQAVDNEIQRLTSLYQNVEESEKQQIIYLVKVYESMRPEQAANLISEIDEKVALKILNNMKGKKAGAILSQVNPTKAGRLSEKLAKQKPAMAK